MLVIVISLSGCSVYNIEFSDDGYPSIRTSPCGAFTFTDNNEPVIEEFPLEEFSFDYFTFEEALLEFATDIVIVQYASSRPFGYNLTEFEFIVLERILGDSTDRILVREVSHWGGGLEFSHGVDYILPLMRANSPYLNIDDDRDRFVFLRNTVIDLEEPVNSVMYSESLDSHVGTTNLVESTSAEEIISFVEAIAEQIQNKQRRELIFTHSEEIQDIIDASPYVLVVEVNAPFRLSYEQTVNEGGLTDLYYVNVVQSLKGDFNGEAVIAFSADTVFTGEKHIVAVQSTREGSNWFFFTSRNSLFSINQLDEIMLILYEQ